MTASRPAGLIAMTAAALALGACGGDDEKGPGTAASTQTATTETAEKAAETVGLEESEFKIVPKTVTVEKTGKVTFEVKNVGSTVHALEVEGPEGEAETEEIQPGATAKLTVNLSKAGTYEMYCPVGNHKEQGMTGEIVVAGGGSGGEDSTGQDQAGTATEQSGTTTSGGTTTNGGGGTTAPSGSGGHRGKGQGGSSGSGQGGSGGSGSGQGGGGGGQGSGTP